MPGSALHGFSALQWGLMLAIAAGGGLVVRVVAGDVT